VDFVKLVDVKSTGLYQSIGHKKLIETASQRLHHCRPLVNKAENTDHRQVLACKVWYCTHPFNGPLSRNTQVSGTRKVKPIWILLKQEIVTGSGISWAICKSAPRSRQITMPAPHYSVFLQAGCPSCHPTNSVKALKAKVQKAPKVLTQNGTLVGPAVFVGLTVMTNGHCT